MQSAPNLNSNLNMNGEPSKNNGGLLTENINQYLNDRDKDVKDNAQVFNLSDFIASKIEKSLLEENKMKVDNASQQIQLKDSNDNLSCTEKIDELSMNMSQNITTPNNLGQSSENRSFLPGSILVKNNLNLNQTNRTPVVPVSAMKLNVLSFLNQNSLNANLSNARILPISKLNTTPLNSTSVVVPSNALVPVSPQNIYLRSLSVNVSLPVSSLPTNTTASIQQINSIKDIHQFILHQQQQHNHQYRNNNNLLATSLHTNLMPPSGSKQFPFQSQQPMLNKQISSVGADLSTSQQAVASHLINNIINASYNVVVSGARHPSIVLVNNTSAMTTNTSHHPLLSPFVVNQQAGHGSRNLPTTCNNGNTSSKNIVSYSLTSPVCTFQVGSTTSLFQQQTPLNINSNSNTFGTNLILNPTAQPNTNLLNNIGGSNIMLHINQLKALTSSNITTTISPTNNTNLQSYISLHQQSRLGGNTALVGSSVITPTNKLLINFDGSIMANNLTPLNNNNSKDKYNTLPLSLVSGTLSSSCVGNKPNSTGSNFNVGSGASIRRVFVPTQKSNTVGPFYGQNQLNLGAVLNTNNQTIIAGGLSFTQPSCQSYNNSLIASDVMGQSLKTTYPKLNLYNNNNNNYNIGIISSFQNMQAINQISAAKQPTIVHHSNYGSHNINVLNHINLNHSNVQHNFKYPLPLTPSSYTPNPNNNLLPTTNIISSLITINPNQLVKISQTSSSSHQGTCTSSTIGTSNSIIKVLKAGNTATYPTTSNTELITTNFNTLNHIQTFEDTPTILTEASNVLSPLATSSLMHYNHRKKQPRKQNLNLATNKRALDDMNLGEQSQVKHHQRHFNNNNNSNLSGESLLNRDTTKTFNERSQINALKTDLTARPGHKTFVNKNLSSNKSVAHDSARHAQSKRKWEDNTINPLFTTTKKVKNDLKTQMQVMEESLTSDESVAEENDNKHSNEQEPTQSSLLDFYGNLPLYHVDENGIKWKVVNDNLPQHTSLNATNGNTGHSNVSLGLSTRNNNSQSYQNDSTKQFRHRHYNVNLPNLHFLSHEDVKSRTGHHTLGANSLSAMFKPPSYMYCSKTQPNNNRNLNFNSNHTTSYGGSVTKDFNNMGPSSFDKGATNKNINNGNLNFVNPSNLHALDTILSGLAGLSTNGPNLSTTYNSLLCNSENKLTSMLGSNAHTNSINTNTTSNVGKKRFGDINPLDSLGAGNSPMSLSWKLTYLLGQLEQMHTVNQLQQNSLRELKESYYLTLKKQFYLVTESSTLNGINQTTRIGASISQNDILNSDGNLENQLPTFIIPKQSHTFKSLDNIPSRFKDKPLTGQPSTYHHKSTHNNNVLMDNIHRIYRLPAYFNHRHYHTTPAPSIHIPPTIVNNVNSKERNFRKKDNANNQSLSEETNIADNQNLNPFALANQSETTISSDSICKNLQSKRTLCHTDYSPASKYFELNYFKYYAQNAHSNKDLQFFEKILANYQRSQYLVHDLHECIKQLQVITNHEQGIRDVILNLFYLTLNSTFTTTNSLPSFTANQFANHFTNILKKGTKR